MSKLDQDQFDFLCKADTQNLKSVVADLENKKDFGMSVAFFALAINPLFRRQNATPENVLMACRVILENRGEAQKVQNP